MDSGRSMFILLPNCVTRRLDSFVFTLSNYEESIGQYRSDNGVVTGKTAEKQDKCNNPHNRFFFFRLCGLLKVGNNNFRFLEIQRQTYAILTCLQIERNRCLLPTILLVEHIDCVFLTLVTYTEDWNRCQSNRCTS